MELTSIRFQRATKLKNGAVPLRAALEDAIPRWDWKASKGNPVTVPILLPRDVERLSISISATIPDGTWVRARASRGMPLGDAAPATVRGGKATLRVNVSALRTCVVDRYLQRWEWETSTDQISWRVLPSPARTEHHVFIAAGVPAAPWGPPGDPPRVVPWHRVIERAILWAGGSGTAEEVATRITTAVHGLGGQSVGGIPIQYGGGQGAYTWSNAVDVDALLDLFELKAGAFPALSCSDLATSVALFSASLGMGLRIVRLQGIDEELLPTNRLRAMGECGGCLTLFNFHEIAVVGDGHTARCWDATFLVDTDGEPYAAPATWELPTGTVVGRSPVDVEETSYVARLLQNETLFQLLPIYTDGLRYPQRIPAAAPAMDAVKERLRARYVSVLSAFSARVSDGAVTVSAWWKALGDRLVWSDQRRSFFVGNVEVKMRHGIWSPWHVGTFLLEAVPVPDGVRAVDVLIEMATEVSVPLVPDPTVGEAALYSLNDAVLLFARGSVVVRIGSVHRRRANMHAAARILDALLR